MSEEAKFDPNDIGAETGNMWGLPFHDDPKLAIIGVPWDVASSFGDGSCHGPEAMLAASTQIALNKKQLWQKGVVYDDTLIDRVLTVREVLRPKAVRVMEHLAHKRQPPMGFTAEVNEGSRWLNKLVEERAAYHRDLGRKVIVLGGDHSTPYGSIVNAHKRGMIDSILHIDAHADRYQSYNGFMHSHASFIWNVKKLMPHVPIVSVGIRDFALAERTHCDSDDWWGDDAIATARIYGDLGNLFERVTENLKGNVHVTFDIDGLNRAYCPNTGTPVPGGISFSEAKSLLDYFAKFDSSDPDVRIVSADLVEVTPASKYASEWENDWNANVGMRVLHELAAHMLAD